VYTSHVERGIINRNNQGVYGNDHLEHDNSIPEIPCGMANQVAILAKRKGGSGNRSNI